MTVICATHLKGFPSGRFPKIILTLGAFDGIHAGHKQIFARVTKEARRIGGTATLLTFQEHPQKVLHPADKTSILTSFWHKLSLIDQIGMDLCLALHFSRAFSRLSPAEFVKKILVDKLRVKKVILGHDARFGHNRAGNARAMAGLARKYGFDFAAMAPVKKEDYTVSSTLIRRLIGEGRLGLASRLLGRPYSIFATVVRGSGRGKWLGFPTANLDPHSEVLPPAGVYAARVRRIRIKWAPDNAYGFHRFRFECAKKLYRAVLNLGTRPTFQRNGARQIPEVHLLDFRGDLYGQTIEVAFLKRLRKERRFETAGQLQEQITKDIEAAIPSFRPGN